MTRSVKRWRISGGSIVTMNAAMPQCGEVAIEDNRVAWCGRAGSAPRAFGKSPVLDLKGRLLLPGFTDSHTHFLYFAVSRSRVDLRGAKSARECAKRVADYLELNGPQKGWVIGHGADPNEWNGENAHETMHRNVLDRVAPNVAVGLFTHDEHTLWVNSTALKKSGITAETPDPTGGKIVRDESGVPTGQLLEEAYNAVWLNIPSPEGRWAQQLIFDTQKEAHRVGVVGLGDVGEPESLNVFAALDQAGKLALRVTKSIPVRQLDWAIDMGLRAGIGSDRFRIGGIKVFLDGALGSRTAWMKSPYSDDKTNYGIGRMDPKEFDDIVRRATARGFPIWAHAIGDAAVNLAIETFARRKIKSGCAMPHRIEHLQLLDPTDLALLSRSGIVGSMQPSHLLTDRDRAEAAWGKKRCAGAFALRSLLDAGVPVAFGSDVPIERLCPMDGIVAAVNRRKDGDQRGPWIKRECISVAEAIHGFTLGAASSHGLQKRCGSIEPGKFADMAVLDQNILECPHEEIGCTEIDVTIFDGGIVYKKDESERAQ